MNKDIEFNSETFKILWDSNKQYLTPLVMIAVSVILLLVAVLPQFNDLLTTLTQRNNELQKLQTLKNDLELLTNIDENTLNSQLDTALKVLPQSKDFESVLTTIALAANNAGVSLGNFEFKVGDLSKLQSGNEQLPYLSITLLVNEGAAGVSRFMTNLATAFPISEVKSVDINGNYSNLTITFYYKNIVSAKPITGARLIPLSVTQAQLLQELSSWSSGSSFVPEISSSASAITSF